MKHELPLIIKYRPQDWDDVLGHEDIINSLRKALDSNSRPHAFLFTGASGIGKTTLARIIANHLQADVVELDAGMNNGIDASRELLEMCQYIPFGGGNRMIILDEAHALSRASWNAFLKTLEEPPDHLFFALCTTESTKVPDTIKTRTYQVPLRPVSTPIIRDFLGAVAATEGWAIPDSVIALTASQATGQPRKALSILQGVQALTSEEEVEWYIKSMDTAPVAQNLMRLVLEAAPWADIQSTLTALDEDQVESVFIGCGRYLSAVMTKSKNEAEASKAWRLLDALVFPATSLDRKAVLYAAVGRARWGG